MPVPTYRKKRALKTPLTILCEEAIKVSGGSPDLWRAIADRQLEIYEWLKSIGAKPALVLLAPGHKITRSIKFEGHGPGLCKVLKKAADDSKIEILQKHRAEKLIVDPEKGRVIGVRAKSGNKTLNFRARKAVILTTGGFCRNMELVKEYGPEYAECVPTAPPTHMGDGLKMALAIGAATAGIGLAVCPSFPVCAVTGHLLSGAGWGGIAVNRHGQRWGNEVTDTFDSYTMRYKEILEQDPTGLHFSIYDEGIRDSNPSDIKPREKIFSAPTIEGLEKVLGIAAGGLKDDHR